MRHRAACAPVLLCPCVTPSLSGPVPSVYHQGLGCWSGVQRVPCCKLWYAPVSLHVDRMEQRAPSLLPPAWCASTETTSGRLHLLAMILPILWASLCVDYHILVSCPGVAAAGKLCVHCRSPPCHVQPQPVINIQTGCAQQRH